MVGCPGEQLGRRSFGSADVDHEGARRSRRHRPTGRHAGARGEGADASRLRRGQPNRGVRDRLVGLVVDDNPREAPRRARRGLRSRARSARGPLVRAPSVGRGRTLDGLDLRGLSVNSLVTAFDDVLVENGLAPQEDDLQHGRRRDSHQRSKNDRAGSHRDSVAGNLRDGIPRRRGRDAPQPAHGSSGARACLRPDPGGAPGRCA